MKNEFEFEGLWWLPHDPETKIPGQVKSTSDDGILLKLSDVPDNLDLKVYDKLELILGLSDTGKIITLYRCMPFNKNVSVSGRYSATRYLLSVESAFIGVHFTNIADISFTKISVHYASLDEWMSINGYFVGGEKRRIEIAYNDDHEPVKVIIKDGQIDISKIILSINENTSSFNITQKAWINISFNQNELLTDCLTIIRHIQNFLSLAIGNPTYPLTLIGESNLSKRQLRDGTEYYNPIEMYIRFANQPENPKQVHRGQMLFTFTDVKDDLSAYITNWFTQAERLKPVYTLYFSILYAPNMYLESQFLSLTQAIETYHRRVHGGKYQSDEEYEKDLYKKLVEAIPSELDKSFKDSLIKGKLRFANEFSLRKRLKQIIDPLSDNISNFFFNSKKESNIFISKVCDTRNYLTHYTSELESKAAEGQELYYLTRKLKQLLEICLLEQAGFNVDFIEKMVSKRKR